MVQQSQGALLRPFIRGQHGQKSTQQSSFQLSVRLKHSNVQRLAALWKTLFFFKGMQIRKKITVHKPAEGVENKNKGAEGKGCSHGLSPVVNADLGGSNQH